VLDLYAGRWEGKLLEPGDMVISADAKPSIQARKRIHPGAPPAPGRGQRVEHEYERMGALTYFDAWDVRRGGVIGRSERKGGIAPFDRLVWQVMTKEPYASARRVFRIVDNGSDHRGNASIKRLQRRWPTLILVHLPVHASWLNQVEIYPSRRIPGSTTLRSRREFPPSTFAASCARAPARRHAGLSAQAPPSRRATSSDAAQAIRLTAGALLVSPRCDPGWCITRDTLAGWPT